MKTVNLVWCGDDNYAQHMGVALCSTLANLSKTTLPQVFIVGNLNTQNKNKILKIAKRFAARAQFIPVDINMYADLKTTDYISPAAYYRLSLPDLLPKDIAKVLYLDGDLIVKDDVTKLFDIDLEDTFFAAVPEAEQQSIYIDRQTLGIPENALYFNTGVLLLNLEKWRAGGWSQKIIEFIKKNPERITWWDQDAMNIFFHNTYKPIDAYWNFSKVHVKNANLQPGCESTYPIGIIHFFGGEGDKPWHAVCVHPLKYEYDRYLKMTPWGGFSLKKLNAVVKKAIKKILRNKAIFLVLSATVLKMPRFAEIKKRVESWAQLQN